MVVQCPIRAHLTGQPICYDIFLSKQPLAPCTVVMDVFRSAHNYNIGNHRVRAIIYRYQAKGVGHHFITICWKTHTTGILPTEHLPVSVRGVKSKSM